MKLDKIRPDLLRSMLFTFALYFFFRDQLFLFKQAWFYALSGQGILVVLLVLAVLLGFNAYRYRKGYLYGSEINESTPYLLHPKRQWMVLLLMPILVLVEEFLFRSCLLNYLLPRLGGTWALGISALVFVLAHEQKLRFDKTNLLLLLYGLAFGAAYILSDGSFAVAFLVHLAVNLQAWAINVRLLHSAGHALRPERFSVRSLWATVKT